MVTVEVIGRGAFADNEQMLAHLRPGKQGITDAMSEITAEAHRIEQIRLIGIDPAIVIRGIEIAEDRVQPQPSELPRQVLAQHIATACLQRGGIHLRLATPRLLHNSKRKACPLGSHLILVLILIASTKRYRRRRLPNHTCQPIHRIRTLCHPIFRPSEVSDIPISLYHPFGRGRPAHTYIATTLILHVAPSTETIAIKGIVAIWIETIKCQERKVLREEITRRIDGCHDSTIAHCRLALQGQPMGDIPIVDAGIPKVLAFGSVSLVELRLVGMQGHGIAITNTCSPKMPSV
mgnify:CR=1 FL=1